MSDKPQEPLSSIYADARQTVTNGIRNIMKAFPIPVFMWESVFEGFLMEIKTEARLELSAETQAYKEQLEAYYNQKLEELEQSKAELIAQFEGKGE